MEEEIAGALGEVRVVGITAIATVAAAMLGVMGVEMAMLAGTEVEMAAETIADKGGARKDRHLHPISSDFDLYSMGKDGDSVKPLTAQKSHDDVIRASDGGYYGLAKNF